MVQASNRCFYSSKRIHARVDDWKVFECMVLACRIPETTSPVGSMDDLAGFIAAITLSARVTRPDIFTKSMVKNVMKLVQQKLIPYLENISMAFPTWKSDRKGLPHAF